MMSCSKVTLLIEKSKIDTLSFKEILNLRMHLAMCSACSNYNKLSKQLDLMFENIDINNIKEIKLSKEKKTEILQVIQEFDS